MLRKRGHRKKPLRRRQLHRRDRTQPWSPVSVAVLLACLCGGAARLIFSNPALVVVLLACLCRGAARLSLSRCSSPNLLEPNPGRGPARLSLSRLIFSNPALVVVLLASLCVAVLLASHPASGIKYPPCYKDIGFWINESFTENNLCELVRGIAGDLVEESFRDLHNHVKVTVLFIFWWLVIGEEELLHENCLKRKVPTSEQGSDKNNGAHNG
ncbi:hypothetical protein Ahy_A02g008557 isoform B [Arachis hypogaea]|uniref:Uncharacterized protein n=1 Tax=Arachis hypogaea TaxID=3818 RepID=A0A445EEL9_ARAHY|nr:hypothetical protein Ahy_A02g008557 isoform B [Arachis hypogaea]